MNLAAALLAPLLLLFPVAGAFGVPNRDDAQEPAVQVAANPPVRGDAPQWPADAIGSLKPEDARQVRIEQRMTIRIVPGANRPMPPEVFAALQGRAPAPRFTERKIGKCLPISGIAGVQPNGGGNLVLFMRDRRLVNAELDRGCRARDFYSGFYLSRSSDGQVCVDRDTLLSRSGANCKLSRIRELVEIDD